MQLPQRRHHALHVPAPLDLAAACMRLVEVAGGEVVGAAFLVEIEPLGGRERLAPHRVESVLTY